MGVAGSLVSSTEALVYPPRVTIADVARAAGVSKTAVSFAFNAPERLSRATLERIQEVSHRLGYTPDPTARALSIRRSGTIGLLIPQGLNTVFANPFLSELIRGVGEVCEEHDLMLVLVPPLNGSLKQAMQRAPVDAFISLGLSADDPELATLHRLGLPSVLVDSDGSAGDPVVNVDDAAGAEAAGRHLLSLGHRRIAFIVLPRARSQQELTPVAARRLSGYQTALAGSDAPEPVTVRAEATVSAGEQAFRELARRRPRPTAVLAMSDMAAIGFMQAARDAGLRVPDDFSVVGYDDVPMAAWTNPPLTTVRQPMVRKGALAARLLIDRLGGAAAASPVQLPTELVVRASTGRARG